MNIGRIAFRNLMNMPGWRTSRKIIVIESDDWGSIRMPSYQVYERLLKRGYAVDRHPYERYDSLASEEDLTFLFELLSSFKDKNGRFPVITANSVVANPDFDRIRDSGFTRYYYEWFPRTLERYPHHKGSFDLWKEGIRKGLFYPQFHGREHFNTGQWIQALQGKNKDVLLAFELGMAGIFPKENPSEGNKYMVALDYVSAEERQSQIDILKDGLKVFTELWGYGSRSFIAPCYVWDEAVEPALKESGVDYMQGGLFQHLPLTTGGKRKKKLHYLGQRNRPGQIYMVRNCSFEPASSATDWVDSCLNQIGTAFRWGKPAIISMHRINFIGSIDSQNRDRNLKLFKRLLSVILQKWPDAEFLNSEELGDEIVRSRKNSIMGCGAG